jgi:predicted DNA binding protein
MMSMRKMVLEVEPYDTTVEAFRPILDCLSSYQVLETLKIDKEKGTCVDLIECQLRDGLSIDETKWFGHMELLSVVKSRGDVHTCLVKYYEPEGSQTVSGDFDVNLIYTTPSLISEQRFVMSVIGDRENLSRFVEIIKENVGQVINMSLKRAAYEKHDILNVLTDRQREVLTAANQYGYYDYPKRINGEELSKKVDISKPVLLQHLRKAEGRIMADIFAGQ